MAEAPKSGAPSNMNPRVNTSGFTFNMTLAQKETLGKFREELKDQLKPMWADSDLLRFLRARDFNIPNALAMLNAHLEWRKKVEADTILEVWPTSKWFKPCTDYWPGHHHKVDNWGVPVWYERVGIVDAKGFVSGVPAAEIVKFHIWVMENHLRVKKETEKTLGRPLEEGMIIIQDLKGVNMKQLYGPALALFQMCMKIDQDNYPESLQKMYMVNAPAIFTVIWGIVKSFFDKKTLDKIEICGGTYLPSISKDIPLENIPSYLGGKCTCAAPGCCPGGGPWAGNQEEDYVSVNVGARDIFTHSVKVDTPNSTITWDFRSFDNDIQFGIRLEKDGKQVEVLKIARFNAHQQVISDSFVATEVGKYFLVFDNTHSYLRGKTVKYQIAVVEPLPAKVETVPEAAEKATENTREARKKKKKKSKKGKKSKGEKKEEVQP